MLYFCTINHGNFPFFSKDGCSVLGYVFWRNRFLPNYYTKLQKKSQFPGQKIRLVCVYKFYIDFLHDSFISTDTMEEFKKRRNGSWTVMPTNALSVLFPSVHTTVRMPTTALWSGSWWAPTRLTPLWIPALIACPSARSKCTGGGFGRRKIICRNTLTQN